MKGNFNAESLGWSRVERGKKKKTLIGDNDYE